MSGFYSNATATGFVPDVTFVNIALGKRHSRVVYFSYTPPQTSVISPMSIRRRVDTAFPEIKLDRHPGAGGLDPYTLLDWQN
jgi:hypothetical protein